MLVYNRSTTTCDSSFVEIPLVSGTLLLRQRDTYLRFYMRESCEDARIMTAEMLGSSRIKSVGYSGYDFELNSARFVQQLDEMVPRT